METKALAEMRLIPISLIIDTTIMLVLSEMLFLHLKQNFAEDWERLGKPDLIFNNNVGNAAKSLNYLWSARHKNQDRIASVYIYAIRTLWCGALVLFVWSMLGPR